MLPVDHLHLLRHVREVKPLADLLDGEVGGQRGEVPGGSWEGMEAGVRFHGVVEVERDGTRLPIEIGLMPSGP